MTPDKVQQIITQCISAQEFRVLEKRRQTPEQAPLIYIEVVDTATNINTATKYEKDKFFNQRDEAGLITGDQEDGGNST